MADERVPTRCDQCGKTDTHPMIHFGFTAQGPGRTVHHDCMSADERDLAFGTADGEYFRKVTELAESGTRGDALLAKIEKMGAGS